MSAPRPFVTDPFYPLGSIRSSESFSYICQSVPVTSSKCYVKVCRATVGIQKLRMCFLKIIQSNYFDFHAVSSGAY